MGPVQTPSPERTEPFDALVREIDDFEPLPSHTVPLESDPPDGENSDLGGMILTGLVSPV
jgi:hypothetical protein